MKNLFWSLALAVILCFACSLEAQAQDTLGYNDMYRYTAANGEERLAAWAETALDYNSWNYYCAVVDLYLYKDYPDGTSELVSQAGGSSCMNSVPGDVNYGRAEADVPYDPGVEYRLEVSHYNEPIYIMPGSGAMEDYYNYAIYEDPMFGQVWYPLYFRFEGPGPSQPSVGAIILGATYAIWTAGALAGPPHHLKLVSDTFPPTDCGSVRRWLKFRVVDADGRRAATRQVRVEETFETASQPPTGIQCIYNSCQADNYCPPSCREINLDGTFIDQLWVGCPSAGGNCGFSPTPFVSRWWWCPARVGRVSLTANTYHITHSQVLVNGRSTSYPPGTEFR